MLTKNVELNNKTILVTGAAGFIGANLVLKLLESTEGSTIVGLDNLNDYYDPRLKDDRLDRIGKAAAVSKSSWKFVKGNLADKAMLEDAYTRCSTPWWRQHSRIL